MERFFAAAIALLLVVTSLAAAPRPSTAIPNDALEMLVLRAVALQTPGWMFPQFETDETNPNVARYRASQTVMAGAVDSILIIRHSTAMQAATAFGTTSNTFHGLPAIQGSYADFQSGHYRNRRWLSWLNGRRSYQITTMYHSTYPGNAADPVPIAEIVYTVAISHGLSLTDAHLPVIATP